MKIENLCKSFVSKTGVRTQVFNGFSTEILDGRVNVITGPSGCGKSTLLNILSGLEIADSGIFTVYENVGYMFQEPRLFPWKTVFDNVNLINGNRETTLELLKRVGLSDCINKYPNELSGGQRQRVSLARALSCKGNVLFLDEPFQGLDEANKNTIISILKQYIEASNATVLWVTHDFDDVKDFDCNYINIR